MKTYEHYITELKELTVGQQFLIAKAIAANCGYQLVEEDDDRSLEIKRAIEYYKISKTVYAHLAIEGLEKLL